MDDDIPNYFIDVSLLLTEYMSEICPTEETRRRRSDQWAFCEVLRSITDKYTRNCSAFLFGSQAEGSTTPGLKSDTNVVLVYNQFIVAQTVRKWDHQCIHCSFSTNGAPPGYVQLQCMNRDFYMMYRTSNERHLPLISHREVLHMFFNSSENVKCAIQLLLGSYGNTVDMSFALQVKFKEIDLPHCLSGQRTNSRLLQVLISDEAKDDYVNLEFKGSPLSFDECFEWRLCFSVTERRLVAAFNSVQMNCYILLKIVVKSFVQPYMGNVLSSYHVKSLMFHTIEATEETMWRPDNLLLCTEMCLKKLSIWVMDGYFPDYFIPENNLFEERVCGSVRFRLIALLNQLLAEKGRFLLRIDCDGIGDIFALQSADRGIIWKDLGLSAFSSELYAIRTYLDLIQNFLRHSYRNHPFKLLQLLQYEYNHGSKLLRQAVPVLIGAVCSRLDTAHYNQPWLWKVRPETTETYFHVSLMIGDNIGNISSSLKLAAVNYICKYPMKAVLLLQSVQETLNLAFSKASVHCNCSVWKTVDLLSREVSIGNMLMKFIAHSVVYIEDEIKYTPEPLVLEMHRSIVCGGHGKQFWHGWAMVDSKVYALFLLHQCYSTLRMNDYRLQTLLKLMRTIDQDTTLLHRDTAFNLLAYCLKKEGITLASYRCLRHSLLLNCNSCRAASHGHKNAAIWQLAFLYNQDKRQQK